eukprot:TRINITY_DN6481_c0_g1_i1.p1 TRINITY_DN6481_c0_g1~~TRINITY_DN6481_c0_g1_i1.p1  ORF type:complete len:202 (-),score=57.03 TRINITY_DN6481_c0_g1_i1:83-688(-)
MIFVFAPLLFSVVLCAAGKHGRAGHSLGFSSFPAPNAALRELARGAFLNSWPVTNKPELQNLKTESLNDANYHDTDDCAKKLLCELTKKEGLEWDEELLIKYYDQPVNYGSDSLFFNIAVKVGKDGERECVDVYPRCILDLSEMLEILRRQGISFDIPGEERDCQIYFLWKKKDKKKKSLNPSTEDIKLDDEGNITETPEK